MSGVTRTVLPGHLRRDPEGAKRFADAASELADLRAELNALKREYLTGVSHAGPAPRDVRADAFAVLAQCAALRVGLGSLRR